MSAERDILIRIGIQQTENKVKAPDIAPVKAAAAEASKAIKGTADDTIASMNKEFDALKSKLDSAAAYLKQRREEIQDRQIGAAAAFKEISIIEKTAAFRRKKAAETAKAEIAAEEEANRVIQAAVKATANERFKEISIAERTAAHKRQTAAESAETAKTASAQIEAANVRAASATRALGEATLLTIRGFAMLGADGSKDVEKVLQSLLMVQGAIDLFKGLEGILVGITQAYRGVQAAATAAATAQTASAAAGAGAGAAGGAAAGGGLAGFAAKAGLYGAAVVGGFGVGYGINKYLGGNRLVAGLGIGDSGEGETARQEANLRYMEQRDAADLERRQRTRKFVTGAEAEQARYQTATAYSARGRAFELSEANVGIGEANSALGRARTTAERSAAMAGQVTAAGNLRATLSQHGLDIGRDLGAATRQREAAVAQLQAVGANKDRGTRSEYLQARAAALQQQQQAEQNIAEAIQRQTQNRQQQLQAQRQSVELAQQQLQSEKDRVNAVNQGLGSLSEGEQDEVRRIAKKVKAGEQIDEGELKFLEGHGGGAFSEFTQQQRRQRGEAAFGGDADVAAITGGPSQVNELQAALEKLIAGGGTGASVPKLLEQIADDRKREAEAMDKLLQSTKALGDLAAKIDQIRDSIEDVNRREARRRHAAG
jgi:hypothetical protein